MTAHNKTPEQLLPGIAAPRPMILVVPVGAPMAEAETFQSMDALKAATLKPGQYELYRFGGTFSVEEIPARVRSSFQSAITRTRKPGAAKPAAKLKGASRGTSA